MSIIEGIRAFILKLTTFGKGNHPCEDEKPPAASVPETSKAACGGVQSPSQPGNSRLVAIAPEVEGGASGASDSQVEKELKEAEKESGGG